MGTLLRGLQFANCSGCTIIVNVEWLLPMLTCLALVVSFAGSSEDGDKE